MGNKLGSNNNYIVQKDQRLGSGTFGVVYKGKHNTTGQTVAVKQCHVTGDAQYGVAMKEIRNFQHIVPHKHILQMFSFDYSDDSFWIVMEYCDKGDLTDYMKKYAPDIEKQMKIMHHCTSAVDHMHSLNVPIVHRDIKPPNILFKTEGKSVVAKLADFGLSKILDGDVGVSNLKMGTIVGTNLFMAPEQFAKEKYTYKVDNFALAMVFLAMINYTTAGGDLIPLSASFLEKESDHIKAVGQEMYEAGLAKTNPVVVVKTSPLDNPKLKCVKKMINNMAVRDPTQRKSLKDVLKEIETISVGESSKGMAGKLTASKIFKSNLELTQTRGCFESADSKLTSPVSGKSSGYGGSGDISKRSQSSDTESDGQSTGSGSSAPKKEEGPVTAEEEPDIGYILMRQMIEEHVKKKREEELKEKKAREEAEKLARALPLLMLLKLMESDSDNAQNFQIGDKVVVDHDIAKARQLQVNYGGWSDKMEKYLGEEGTVKEITDGRVTVQFPDGTKLMWNAHLLGQGDDTHKGKSGGLKDSKFKMNDVVRIKVNAEEFKRIQLSGSAGWRDKMKNALGIRGAVHRVHSDGDVLVEFMNGDKWWISPRALEVCDMSGVEIEAGDTVVVLDDRKKVQELQKGHGEWTSGMEKCLGKSGIVRKVGANQRAIVEIENTKYVWNTACLKLIAKSEEMILVMLKKHLIDK